MTQEQRVEALVEIAKSKAINGVVKKSAIEQRDTIKLYGINLDMVIERAGLVSQTDYRKQDKSRAVDEVFFDADNMINGKIVDNINELKTLAGFVAVAIFNQDFSYRRELINGLGFPQPEQVLKKLKRLLEYSEESLETLTLQRLDEILESLKDTYTEKTNAIVDRKIKNLLSFKAIELGLFVPAAIEFNQGVYCLEFVEKERTRIKDTVTVYEHGIMLFSEVMPYKSDALLALREYASVKPEFFALERLNNYKKGIYSKAAKSAFHRALIDNILMPLQESGLEFADSLRKRYNKKVGIIEKYVEYLENKDNIKKEDRTFGWYVFQYSGITKQTPASILAKIHHAYADYFDVQVKDLVSSDLEELRSRASVYKINAIFHAIAEDGLCSSDVLYENTSKIMDRFDFNSPVWCYGRNGSISFEGVDGALQKPVRHYVERMLMANREFRKSYLFRMIEMFKQARIYTLDDLDSEAEMRLYLTLKASIVDSFSHNIARHVLKFFRSFVGELQKRKLDLVPNAFVFNYDLKIKSPPVEIVVYDDRELGAIVGFLQSDESETCKYMNRLELCVFGIQALTARRVGEIVSESAGLTIDAIYEWGNSGELMMKYFSPKHKKYESVLLSDLVGRREDAFAKVLVVLVLKLFDEALKITSEYRHALPDELKNQLFVVRETQTIQRLYKKLSTNFYHTGVKKLYRDLGIDTSKTAQTFRHTLVTAIILSGGTVMDAADAIQDQVSTVAKYYHEFTSRADTLKHFAEKGRTVMVDSLSDSQHFLDLEKNQHRVLWPDEMSPEGYRMAGGSCVETVEGRLRCKSYQMIRSAKGCSGCRYLEVNAEDNKAYWQREVDATFKAMEAAVPRSIAYKWEESNNQRARSVLESIEQKELENEFA